MSPLGQEARLIRARLLGESLRECGVLVLIFAPLDILLEVRGAIVWPKMCWWGLCVSSSYAALLFFAVSGILLLYYGIRIEGEAELALKEIEKGGRDDISDAAV